MGDPEELLTAALEAALASRGLRLTALEFNQNRVRLASWKRRGDDVSIRLSSRASVLGPALVAPLAGCVLGDKVARGELRGLFKQLPPAPKGARRAVVLRPQGEVYDLREILLREAQAPHGTRGRPDITWGRRYRQRPGQRTVRLGSYHPGRELIQVHRILDSLAVPEWLVGFVVFHELLHHQLGIPPAGARRRLHAGEFRRLERSHPRYEEALAWERKELPRLLRAGAR